MKYFEFVGLPGAGKTTSTRKLRALLQLHGRRPLMRAEILRIMMCELLRKGQGPLWILAGVLSRICEDRIANLLWEKTRSPILFRFLAEHPEFSQQVIDCARHAAPPHWIPAEVVCAENLIDWLFTHAVQYQAARELAKADDILIMEEGFCQQVYYLTAFYQGHFREKQLYDFLNMTPKPDIFIALLPDAEECEKRMHRRKKGVASDILSPLTVQQRLDVLEHRSGVYQSVADYWEEQGVAVLRVRNETQQEVKALFLEDLLPLLST